VAESVTRMVSEEGTAAAADFERELVGRARAGDGRAFAALVRPHLPMLARLAGRLTGDSAVADEAVQETLMTACRRLPDYRPGSSLRAFLAAIVVRRSYTLNRSEARRHIREENSEPPAVESTAEERLGAARLAQRVREALARLPEKRRQAALLRLEGELSHKEIAQALGSTERSVRVLVHLALKELRELLGGEDG